MNKYTSLKDGGETEEEDFRQRFWATITSRYKGNLPVPTSMRAQDVPVRSGDEVEARKDKSTYTFRGTKLKASGDDAKKVRTVKRRKQLALLRRGRAGGFRSVRQIQKKLVELGFMNPTDVSRGGKTNIDNDYGITTYSAIVAYQTALVRDKQLPPGPRSVDGLVGPTTGKLLRKETRDASSYGVNLPAAT